ncbi:MAG: glycine cleavage system protein H [Deltaproteobacteria bacterium]|nr:glycine cleavage system protein H [Deltaproteobacteria bacterium]MDP7630688.1 glycine cleavage system protein GcvH [SAR324 cluster bacterium]
MSEIPEELLYTREHEWIRLDGNKGEVGITAYAQQSLGDIVYVELPSTEDEIDIGDEFGTIESVKAVSSLFMPATGRILEVNTALKERPELINEDCYDEGWLVRISLDNPEDQEDMMDAEAYREFLEEVEG